MVTGRNQGVTVNDVRRPGPAGDRRGIAARRCTDVARTDVDTRITADPEAVSWYPPSPPAECRSRVCSWTCAPHACCCLTQRLNVSCRCRMVTFQAAWRCL